MSRRTRFQFGVLGVLAMGFALGVVVTLFVSRAPIENEAQAAGGKVKSPTGIAPDRYVYYPGTEALEEGEIRIFAAGTGLPAARRGQAATCFLIECGNGDKFFSMVKPRHAVCFHWFNEEGTRYLHYDAVRQTYDGPLSMATDLMVWNVAQDKITERMAVITENAWSVPGTAGQLPPEKGRDPVMTEFIESGRYDVMEAEKKMFNEFWNKHGVVPSAPYDKIYDLDEINPEFPQADVALVIGANDVVNPVARSNPDSPIYGMPILDADKAQNVIVIKRGQGAGFSGIENHLFYAENTRMLYGDGQKAVGELIGGIKQL